VFTSSAAALLRCVWRGPSSRVLHQIMPNSAAYILMPNAMREKLQRVRLARRTRSHRAGALLCAGALLRAGWLDTMRRSLRHAH
jgi:hypothetical protein